MAKMSTRQYFNFTHIFNSEEDRDSTLSQIRETLSKLDELSAQYDTEPSSLNFELIEQREIEASPFNGYIGYTLFEYQITIEFTPPCLNGWELSAVIDFENDLPLIRKAHIDPNTEIPQEFTQVDHKRCDHCGHRRKRKQSFIVFNEEEGYKVVGSACVKEFLGLEYGKVKSLVDMIRTNWSQYLPPADENDGRDDMFAPRERKTHSSTLGYLTAVIRQIKEEGWLSKSKAYETQSVSTAAKAWWVFEPVRDQYNRIISRPEPPTEEEKEEAAKAQEWAKNIEVTNEYTQNIKNLANMKYFPKKYDGFVASIVNGYRKTLGAPKKENPFANSVHVGTKGQRTTFTVKVYSISSFESNFGTKWVINFLTNDGNALTWFCTSPDKADQLERLRQEDKEFELTGTVKDHSEFRNTKQTIVNRCKVS